MAPNTDLRSLRQLLVQLDEDIRAAYEQWSALVKIRGEINCQIAEAEARAGQKVGGQ